MRTISVILLLMFATYVFSDDTNGIYYDPVSIFDESLEKSKNIIMGGKVISYTGIAILLAGSVCFGLGYTMIQNEGGYNHANALFWSGVGGMAGGFVLSFSGIMAWFAGNKRAIETLENKTEYLRITSGL